MSWLKRVIARLLGHQIQPLEAPVLPTQTAGLANKAHTQQVGNKRSVATSTKPRKSLPVQQPLPKKQKSAKPTTAVSKDSSKKPKAVQTAKSRTTAGNSTQTVAPRTRQAAKPAPKRKP
jgi:hypothetical protein